MLALTIVLALSLRDTLRDPVVRRATIALPYLDPQAAPLRLVFLSDIHVAGPEMPPARLARIVAQINMLRPDIVLIGGDFMSERTLVTRRYRPSEAVTPLNMLKARYGTAVVLGNHDAGTPAEKAELTAALLRARVRVVVNEAVRLGPVTVVGVGNGDDQVAVWGALQGGLLAKKLIPAGGPPFIGLAHMSFDAAELPEPVRLSLVGHTHCGQIALIPARWWGAVKGIDHCGINHVGGRLMVMTAGLGQSNLPLRLGVPPDIWLLNLVPPKQTGPAASRPGPQ